MPGLFSLPADIMVLAFCAAVIFIVEITVFVHDFPKREIHCLTGLCLHMNFHITCDLLTEIHHSIPFRCGKNLFRRQSFLLGDHLPLLWNHGMIRTVKHLSPCPF